MFINERRSVSDDIPVADGGKEADLVQGVLSFFLIKFRYGDLLQGVVEAILLAGGQRDCRVGALSKLPLKREILQRDG